MGEQGPYQAFCVYMPVSLFASSASRVAYRMACLKAKQWWEFSRCGRDRIPGEETHRRDVQPSRIRSFRPLLKPTGFSRWLFSASPASAVSITYEAIDLPDTTLGEDLWKYRYTVSGQPFATNEGFSIFFDPLNYASLENPAPIVNPDWDVLILQPDVFLPDDGVYDALALANNPSLSDTFNLTAFFMSTSYFKKSANS
jgi:hypothetical protein